MPVEIITKNAPYQSGASERSYTRNPNRGRKFNNKKGVQIVVTKLDNQTFWKSIKRVQPDGKVFTQDFINGVPVTNKMN